jgi:putative transposase
MARLARVVLPGYPHHITQRGVRGMDIFASGDDRLEYLHHMAEQGKRYGVEFLSWCLMTNHVHLVAVPEKEVSLARGIGEAHRQYARTVNFRERIRGHLFQERFHSCPTDERHFIASVRYAERNPVRAGMVELPWAYEWSSAAWRTGRRGRDHLVEEREPFGLDIDWEELLLSDPGEMEVLRERSRTGRPCGNEDFIDLAERIVGRTLRRLPRGRPRKQRRWR